MPRPLRAINTRNPTKTKNNFASSVGADLCVGPLRTCRFRPRAHTQVRPYKAADMSGVFVGAGPIRRAQHPRPLRATATRNPTKTQNDFAYAFPFLPHPESPQAARSGDDSGRGQIPLPFSGRIRLRTR